MSNLLIDPALVIEHTIAAMPELARKREELQRLSNRLRGFIVEDAIARYAIGVSTIIATLEPFPTSKGSEG